jgi:GrpB-like predicted nucleotidyltransferase (UPF0157 family)
MPNSLRDQTSLRSKYTFEPYNPLYIDLYMKEEKYLRSLDLKNAHIYHIGSTSISGVGGKGVIDILITVATSILDQSSQVLIKAGYEFRESGGEKTRLFHQKEIKGRRYHIHLSPYNTKSAIEAVAFRDYLRNDKNLAAKYSEIKKQASQLALKQIDKDLMKKTYAEAKAPVIEEILKKVRIWINDNIEQYSNI